jgi:hypothetical protein
VIVALQHVIRDLRHELENVRADNRYAAFALEPLHAEGVEHPRAPYNRGRDAMAAPIADVLAS